MLSSSMCVSAPRPRLMDEMASDSDSECSSAPSTLSSRIRFSEQMATTHGALPGPSIVETARS